MFKVRKVELVLLVIAIHPISAVPQIDVFGLLERPEESSRL